MSFWSSEMSPIIALEDSFERKPGSNISILCNVSAIPEAEVRWVEVSSRRLLGTSALLNFSTILQDIEIECQAENSAGLAFKMAKVVVTGEWCISSPL